MNILERIFRFVGGGNQLERKGVRQLLRNAQELVPEIYRETNHFRNSVEFLNNNEYGLALESLLEMAVDNSHCFPKTFWLSLANCAVKMNMQGEAKICRSQIEINRKEYQHD